MVYLLCCILPVAREVDRDDLPDQGAGHVAECISNLKTRTVNNIHTCVQT